MQIHLWAELKSPILFGAGLGETKKRRAGRSGSPKIKKPQTLRNGAFNGNYAVIKFQASFNEAKSESLRLALCPQLSWLRSG